MSLYVCVARIPVFDEYLVKGVECLHVDFSTEMPCDEI